MVYVYDIETYPNLFTVTFKNVDSGEVKVFVIHEDRNDLDKLYSFLMSDSQMWLLGYNSFNFDNQILNAICKYHPKYTMSTAHDTAYSLFNLATLIVEQDYSELKYRLPFNFIDLMKVGGFLKSLKLLGVSMKWSKLQDLPIPMQQHIKKDEIDLILKYNLNDVLITEKLYQHLKKKIDVRFEVSKLYDVNVYSESDSGMANRLLEKFYSEVTGLEKKYFKTLRTDRKFIRFDWVVFDEINFKTMKLMKLYEDVINHVYYKDKPFFSKKVTYDGVEYKLGIGGIHSVDSGAVFEEDDKVKVIDADITSMYPMLMINHNITPAHLSSKFMKKYKDILDQRVSAKKEGRKAENESLKIVLNSTYGKMKNENHWLFDPLAALKVTINGQLYILMLIEDLVLHNFKVISANTDGVTAIVPRDREEEYYSICENWEHKTRFNLEYTYYSKYARRDVNNYIAIQTNGEVKTKGVFLDYIDLAKGYDKPIVSKALYEFFVNNKPIKETILSCDDIYDFCIAKKIGDDFANQFHTIVDGKHVVEKLQKSVRYYVSTDGGTLLKEKEDGSKTNYESGKRVTIFNDYVEKDMKNYNIDYPYYINHVQKIIDEIINPQLTLF
jgi:DNA polymerase elongation subunit (family B)